ncbi:MAG TPA: hypothetical protein VGX76_20950 [Pirellulales bacterium]|nr:hypothetical protein [Pirellulales bacterium]
MTPDEIEQLKQVDAGTLERFAALDPAEQRQIIALVRGPADDPAVEQLHREIAEARAEQFKRAASHRQT